MDFKCDNCGIETSGLMFTGTDKQGNKHDIKICFDCLFERWQEQQKETSKKDSVHNADRK